MMRKFFLILLLLGFNYGCNPEEVESSATETKVTSTNTVTRGPQGAQGLQGPVGPMGPQGPQGPKGDSTSGSWKLLAKATNYSRIAEYELQAEKVMTWYSPEARFNTSTDYVSQVALADWPQTTVKQILFIVRNPRDLASLDPRLSEVPIYQANVGFCVGGGGEFDRVNSRFDKATCMDRRWRPDSNGRPSKNSALVRMFNIDRWVRLAIDGAVMNQCDDPQLSRDTGLGVGTWGHTAWWDVQCTYNLNSSSPPAKLQVQEVAATTATSWQWEIWYR